MLKYGMGIKKTEGHENDFFGFKHGTGSGIKSVNANNDDNGKSQNKTTILIVIVCITILLLVVSGIILWFKGYFTSFIIWCQYHCCLNCRKKNENHFTVGNCRYATTTTQQQMFK